MLLPKTKILKLHQLENWICGLFIWESLHTSRDPFIARSRYWGKLILSRPRSHEDRNITLEHMSELCPIRSLDFVCVRSFKKSCVWVSSQICSRRIHELNLELDTRAIRELNLIFLFDLSTFYRTFYDAKWIETH